MRNDDETRDEDGNHGITGIIVDPPSLARDGGNQRHYSNPNEVGGTQRPGCQRDPATRKGGATSWLPEAPPGRSLPIVFQKGILVMDNAL